MLVAYLFIVGVALGSFANALAWRLTSGKKIVSKLKSTKKRSICESCQHQLGILDLVPVISWVFLRGKCRYCRTSISYWHPLTELASGLLFSLSIAFWPYELVSSIEILKFVLWLVMLVGLEVIVINDIKFKEIDNRVIYTLIVGAIGWRFIEAIADGNGSAVMQEMTLGLLVGAGLFLFLFWISKEKWIGGGDVKLGIYYGAWLGPLYSMVAMTVAFYSAFLLVVPLMIFKKLNRKSKVPFGPFLILGVFVATLWGSGLGELFNSFVGR